jgi:hypothetical protein
MATYTIASTGTPNYPLTLSIAATINVSHSFNQNIGTIQEVGSTAFNDLMTLCSNNVENAYKTLTEYVTQDTIRNQSWSFESTGNDGSGNNTGVLTTNYTINNAVVNLVVNTQSDLVGEDLDIFLQGVADNAVAAFKTGWGWVDL